MHLSGTIAWQILIYLSGGQNRCSQFSRGTIMNQEPDIERIKKEILERASYRYEMRIADLKSQLDRTMLTAKV